MDGPNPDDARLPLAQSDPGGRLETLAASAEATGKQIEKSRAIRLEIQALRLRSEEMVRTNTPAPPSAD